MVWMTNFRCFSKQFLATFKNLMRILIWTFSRPSETRWKRTITTHLSNPTELSKNYGFLWCKMSTGNNFIVCLSFCHFVVLSVCQFVIFVILVILVCLFVCLIVCHFVIFCHFVFLFVCLFVCLSVYILLTINSANNYFCIKIYS